MKILCVLYDDPKKGMPKSYPLSSLPKLDKYPDGMALPSPKGIDFNPGELPVSYTHLTLPTNREV